MVKGISRQVILVQSPDQKLFEQAIFILKENAVGEGITDEALLKEAKRVIHTPGMDTKAAAWLNRSVWAAGGALATGLVWLLSAVL